MREVSSPDAVFDLLGDEYVRDILAAVSREPMTASQVSERCDMSVSTVYRRAETLEDRGLLVERTQLDPEGHHRTVYEAAFDGIDVDLADGEFSVAISPREDAVDRFTRVWEHIREG